MTYIPGGPSAARGLGYTNSDYYSAIWKAVSEGTNGVMNPTPGTQYDVYDMTFTVVAVEDKQFVLLHDAFDNAVEIPGWRWSPYL